MLSRLIMENIDRTSLPLIAEYQNMKVARKYSMEKGIPLDVALGHFEEMKTFLWLCANTNELCSPSKPMDDVWHTFILFTRDYHFFCSEFLGKFVHHNPTEQPETERYAHTRLIACGALGDLDPYLWPVAQSEAADCDSSCSGDTYCSDCSSCNSGGDG